MCINAISPGEITVGNRGGVRYFCWSAVSFGHDKMMGYLSMVPAILVNSHG
ncbi:MAG: hypothetical protein WC015_09625 [Methanoregula sp.]